VKPTKRLFSIAIAALLASAAVQAQTALDDVLKSKTLKVAIPTDSAPYGYVGTDLKPIGLDIDMANYIGKKLGVAVELVPVTSANRIPALQTRKADLVISTLGKNAEREKVIDFTIAYSPFFQAVFGPKALNAKSFSDLAGKSVGVTRGAMEDQELTKVAPPSTDTKRFEDNNATIAAFVSGQVQFVATGRLGRRQHDGQEPAARQRVQAAPQRQPQFHRRGQGRGQAANPRERDHRRGQEERRHRHDGQEVARSPGRRPAPLIPGKRACHDESPA
jgi:polar amino acid transport system substrate-binding protein